MKKCFFSCRVETAKKQHKYYEEKTTCSKRYNLSKSRAYEEDNKIH
jgi:hypothetical protein